MYSKELEEFIDLILADGEISDKEREILRKKAVQANEDPDEVEIVVDGRLAKMKKAASVPPPAPQAAPSAPASAKMGSVAKCPQCGAVVEPGSARCGECGYTFRNIEAVGSVARFSEGLEKIESESKGSVLSGVASLYGWDSRTKRLITHIQSFPVPNAKEDLLEFLMYLEPKKNLNSQTHPQIARAYKSKYQECVNKAKIYFPDDPQFKALLGEKKSIFGKLFGK